MNETDTVQADKTQAGRTAVVTGGGRGIGAAIVRRLAADGASVVFSYRDDTDAADRLVKQIRADGGSVWAVKADQADRDAVIRLFDEADRRFAGSAGPGLNVLVVNAGTVSTCAIDEVSEDDYERIMAVNTKGAFFTLQQAFPRLRDHARVVAVSTMSTVYASGGESVYAASKAAVEQFIRVAAKELGPRGITANTIAPGPTDTDLLRAAVPEEARQAVAHMTPLGRLAQPSDIAEVAAFLIGPDSGWITGQNIPANGGLV
ncbi:SDR family oxidoreductase [Nocardia fluminea]|nr:SDR family oxidoreductase [Nocardia fluminea]